MPKLSLFEYTALYHFKTEKDNAGNDITKDSLVIVAPVTALFANQDAAAKKVARLIPEKYENELHLCEVIVRPF